MLDDTVQSTVKNSLQDVRTVISDATLYGLALPAYSASLAYFDVFRSEKMPSNLIQAQRDYFGAHTYELIGVEGSFHTDWDRSVTA